MKQQQKQQQQWSLSRVLLLVLLGIYCFCGIATAIPISDEGDDDDYGGSGPSLFAEGGGGADALQIAPRRGGCSRREEQKMDLYSVLVDKRNNNWGENGNGNEGEFFALNNNSPVVGGDGSGSLGGKVGDGQTLELASLSSSSPFSGGGDSSISSTSSGDTLVKQPQSSDIDSSAS